ncbi:MAG: ammonium transporter [Dehalococcoidia bacterium]|nr:ammonium transporter [Dehalococcoidia bacterium]
MWAVPAFAADGTGQTPGAIDTGDTAWLLVCAAMVMLMTPALGFFYGGLVRRKNVLSTIMQSFFVLALISVQWVLWGYSLAFGPDKGGIIGGLEWIGLNGVGLAPNPDYAPTVPHQAFVIFQMMFAIITPALITGAFAERKRFKAFVFFTLLWATFVYDPIAHWVWGNGGWLKTLGALDFAGGSVVHISAGVSSLVAALMMGRRLGFGKDSMEPHDSTMTILGAGLLWFGWFGFNAGSALGSGSLATSTFLVTNTAGAMAAITWMTVSWMHTGRPSALGMAVGGIVGLATVTPAAGFITVQSAILIGLVAGIVPYFAMQFMKGRLGIDDSLDVLACHGIGGTLGTIAVGLLATVAVNPAGANGWFYGNPGQLWVQLLLVVVTWVYSAGATFIILKVIDRVIGLRVPEHEELAGLDESQHGEVAYQL